MRRMIGFIMFWIAIGMFVMFFITSKFFGIIIIALLLFIGYNLFCS